MKKQIKGKQTHTDPPRPPKIKLNKVAWKAFAWFFVSPAVSVRKHGENKKKGDLADGRPPRPQKILCLTRFSLKSRSSKNQKKFKRNALFHFCVQNSSNCCLIWVFEGVCGGVLVLVFFRRCAIPSLFFLTYKHGQEITMFISKNFKKRFLVRFPVHFWHTYHAYMKFKSNMTTQCQSLEFSKCGQLSQVMQQFHVIRNYTDEPQSRNLNCSARAAVSMKTNVGVFRFNVLWWDMTTYGV